MSAVSDAELLDVFVADAGSRPGLVAVRDLGRAELAVGALDIDPHAAAFASRWCRVGAAVPDFHADRDAYLDAVIELCSSHRARALIPAHDGSVEALRSRRQEIERVVGLALAPEPALQIAVDKLLTLAAAEKLGLRSPRGAAVHAESEGAAAIEAVGLPAVVKPVRSWAQGDAAGQRLLATVATTPEEARGAVSRILREGIEVLVQEWLPGDREALSFFRAHGRTWARFAQRADRTAPPLGGNSVLRVSIPMPPDTAEAAERLVAELGLDGYTEVEFRRDSRGRAALMEINPRLSAAVEVAVRSGVSFPRLLYRWAAGEPLTESSGYRTGVRMRWMGGDVEWLQSAFTQAGRPDIPSRRRAVSTFMSDFARPTGYDYLDRADLAPAVRASASTTDAVRELAARRGRRLRDASDGLDTDVAVIGAGPYGLAVAAHLRALGVRHEVFGQLMDLWSGHMPAGMCLKSEGFASWISSPDGRHTLFDYCAAANLHYADIGVPVALDTFNGYGRWFAGQLVPDLRPHRVEVVRRARRGFALYLDDGQLVRARRVVIATGLQGYRRLPEELAHLPPDRRVHAYDVTDPAPGWPDSVAVLGAGQSALETSTLLAEAGVDVRLLARADTIYWPTQPRGSFRRRSSRVRDPLSGLGEGWRLRAYADHPLAFHALPAGQRLARAYTELGPAGSWWLRPRFERQVPALLGRRIRAAVAETDGVRLQLDGPAGAEELFVGRIVAATGYAPDLARLPFIDADLREEVRLAGGAPVLDRGFQSSASGLYFAGYSAAASFGPVMRFVFGTGFAAPRIARELAPLRSARAGAAATVQTAAKKAATARDIIANARATVSVAVHPPARGSAQAVDGEPWSGPTPGPPPSSNGSQAQPPGTEAPSGDLLT